MIKVTYKYMQSGEELKIAFNNEKGFEEWKKRFCGIFLEIEREV